MKKAETIKTYKDIDTFDYNPEEFTYQQWLTTELERKVPQQIYQDTINEIVLWKVNRYVQLKPETIDLLNAIDPEATQLEDVHVHEVLEQLLNTDGVRLPMASSILRFRNPRLFQIIDQRAYRVVYGKELPASYTSKGYGKAKNYGKSVNERVEFYLDYLKELQKVAIEKGWKFEDLDRILYMLDKKINNEKKIKT